MNIPFQSSNKTDKSVREARRAYFYNIMIHRLVLLGTPQFEAVDITDHWSNTYVQLRPLSYRIPLGMGRRAKDSTTQILPAIPIPHPLDDMDMVSLPAVKFVQRFLRHIEILTGTINR